MIDTNTIPNNDEPSPSAMGKSRPNWRRAHEELSRLAKARARLDWEEARSMLVALRSAAHVELGFATFAEYIERLFGYAPRWTSERLRVAEALERLPQLDEALREGTMSWSAVRELTRVAVPENEHQWLDIARGRSQRQIEELVSGHKLGDAPGEPSDTAAGKRVLRFEVGAETLATFREAMARLRRDSGAPLDDDAGLLLMARHVLGGPTDAGRASYQVALTVCEECRRGWQRGAGEPIPVGSSAVETAQCDAQHIGHVETPPNLSSAESTSQRARQDIPPAVRRQVMTRDGGRCVVPGCRNGVFLDLHHIELRSEGGNHDPDALIVTCAAHHRAVHRGHLIIEGRVSTGLSFRHADGTRYGSAVDPSAAEAQSEAFRALRSLGFRENETRKALRRVRDDTHVGHRTTEGVLRAALSVLASARARRIIPN